ncbi:MAG: MATE family efflux transporter [Anaerocolumna sp.]
MNKSSFKAEILSLALPFMVQSIFSNSFSFIDILMVSNLGDVKVSALAVVGQLSFILGMILSSISGITVYITQFFWIEDWKNTRKSFVLMLQSSALASFVSVLISMSLVIGYVYKKKYYFNISLKDYMKFDNLFFRKVYKRITPLLFHEVF